VKRPRLLFLRQDRHDLPAFVLRHLDEHVRALRAHFDVALIDGPCDLDRECDRHEPDLVLIESGVYARRDRRIDNTHRHLEIPRIGFVNADAYCQTRSVFFSDMDRWGVETFFTISMSMRDRMPEIADRLYVWPNFADTELYRTYPGGRTTDLLLTGSTRSNYPWRSAVSAVLRERFGVEQQRHDGWFDARAAAGMPHGEQYARSLSAARIVPTCGTIAHELVRKHLEIPASGALLLTERTAAVESAGFVDMVSCVMADETDVVDKVTHLLEHPEVLDRIAAAGQALVRRRHDLTMRDQMRQWYELSRTARPGDRIVQPDPFGLMQLRPAREGGPQPSVDAVLAPAAAQPARDVAVLARGEGELRSGRADVAQRSFEEVLTWHHMPEATRGLARACLAQGDAHGAAVAAWEPIEQCIRRHRAYDPDPVDWAMHVRVLLCSGDVRGAVRAARCFPDIDHVELRRVRAAAGAIASRSVPRGPARHPVSVHSVPGQMWSQWLEALMADLVACGQVVLAARVGSWIGGSAEQLREPPNRVAASRSSARPSRRARELPRALRRSPGRWIRRHLTALERIALRRRDR